MDLNASSKIEQRNDIIQSSTGSADLFLKRDDLLHNLVGGAKFRKFGSLIRNIELYQPTKIYVQGSLNSHALFCTDYWFGRFGIEYTPVLKNTKNYNSNALNNLLINRLNAIWLSKKEYDYKFRTSIDSNESLMESSTWFLAEGCLHEATLESCLSLANEIIEYCKKKSTLFDYICFDAGSGFTSVANLAVLQNHKFFAATKFIVYDMASNQSAILHTAKRLTPWLHNQGYNLNINDRRISIVSPITAKSFGAVNSVIRNYICQKATENKIYLDPVYSSKFMYSIEQAIRTKEYQGNILAVLSGCKFLYKQFKRNFV